MKERGKRLLGLLMAVCLVVSLLPAGALAAGETEVNTWSALQKALEAGDDVQLTADIVAANEDTGLIVPSGKTVTLDLNNHTIDRGLSSGTTSGSVITVSGSLTLKGSGTITGGYSTDANPNSIGSGIIVKGESSSNPATLTLAAGGPTISGNHSYSGGGVYVGENATLFMRGGSITNNYAKIEGNTAQVCNGGGVYLSSGAKFEMSSGSITGNEAYGNGGGVYVAAGAEFQQSGGSISANKTTRSNSAGGGGVYAAGTVKLSENSNITANTAKGNGGGVYVTSSGSLDVAGAPQITGNTCDSANNNVYLPTDKKISVSGVLYSSSRNAQIGITTQTNPTNDAPVVFTTGYSSSNDSSSPSNYFFDDTGNYVVKWDSDTYTERQEAQLSIGHTHVAGDPGGAIEFNKIWVLSGSLPTEAGNYYLTQDVTLSNSWAAPAGTTNLCLNGKKINLNGNNINVSASRTLNLYDDEGNGQITGNSSTYYYGSVNVSGTVNMYGGTICNNGTGSGVNVKSNGTFTMYGGSIREIKPNTIVLTGVYIEGGTFNMCAGTIHNNKYGGVNLKSGTFNLSGGSITGNSEIGVNVENGVFNVSGNPVVENNT